MKPRLLVVSHGKMAEETLRSAEMIVGPIQNAYAISMLENDGSEGLRKKIANLLETLEEQPTLILADLYGGTPCNVANALSMASPNFTLVAGLTLGMIIEYAVSTTESSSQLATELVDSSKAGILKIEVAPVVLDDDEIEIE